MTAVESLRAALADRYSIEREIGAGGMATVDIAGGESEEEQNQLETGHGQLH